MMNETGSPYGNFERRIAGDIVLSEMPGEAIYRWRRILNITQRSLAKALDISPSVISDYESGRRKSPGVCVIKNMVNALLTIDVRGGAGVFREINNSIYTGATMYDSIVDTKDFTNPAGMEELIALTKGDILASEGDIKKKIYGYVIFDSMKALQAISPAEYIRLCNITAGRALVFIGPEAQKSALFTIKLAGLKPAVVVFTAEKKISPAEERIARIERIPVIISRMRDADSIISAMKNAQS